MAPELVQKLRGLPIERRPPATRKAIAELEGFLGFTLPDNVRELYLDHDGQDPCYPWEYRLMSLAEVRETATHFRDIPAVGGFFGLVGLTLLWSNDNSDYAGLCLREPFRGLVIIIEHDGEPMAFSYRSVENMYSDLIDAYAASLSEDGEELPAQVPSWFQRLLNFFRPRGPGVDPLEQELARWYVGDPEVKLAPPANSVELLTAKSQKRAWRRWQELRKPDHDTPSFREMPRDFAGSGLMPRTEDLPADRERVAALRELYEKCRASELDGQHGQDGPAEWLVAGICALTPLEDSNALVPFLDSDNFYEAADAAKSLGLRRWTPALPKLKWLAEHGVSNARSAARGVVAKMQNRPPLEELLTRIQRAARTSDAHELGLLLSMLEEEGAEVIELWNPHQPDRMLCRLPGSTTWTELRSPPI